MNAAHHKLGSSIVVTAFIAAHDIDKKGRITQKTILYGALATKLGSIPDWIEPATSPNHRQFFHSFVFLGMVTYGGYKLYQWKPKENWQKTLKWVGLVAAIGYGTHLLMDASTQRSLPII